MKEKITHTDDDDDDDDDGMKYMYINNTNASSDSNSENEDDLDLVFAEDLEDNDDNSIIANSTNEKRSKEGKSKKIPQSSFADSSKYEDLINKAWEERRSCKRETLDENDEIDDKQPSTKKRKLQKKLKHKKGVGA